MKAIRITPSKLHLAKFIVDNLLDPSEEKASDMHLQKMVEDERTYLFGVVLEGEIIGFALAYRFPSLYASNHMAYLYDIEVLEGHRRKGVGKLLVETIKAKLKEDGVGELWLGTATDNAAGQALFSRTNAERSTETFHDFTYYLDE